MVAGTGLVTDDPVDRDDSTVLGEILSLPPRLASRTIAQVQASQQLLGMLLCRSSGSDGSDAEAAQPEPDDDRGAIHPTVEPVDVLSVLGREDDDATAAGGDEAAGSTPDGGTGEGDTVPTTAGDAAGTAAPTPDVEDLPIPGYDSLAASQVVPRLTTLSADELDSIGAYEAANRGRRTILNRVTQLQGK